MAITAANKITETSEVSTTSYVTSATLTPAVNDLYLLAVANRVGSGTPNTPTVTGGGGLTWVQVATVQIPTTTTRRITVFRALKTSGLTSGTITVDFAGQTQTRVSLSVDEFAGVDTSGTDGSGAIVQSNTGSAASGTTATVTLSAFGDATNNAAYMASGNTSLIVVTPETGYTELADTGASGTIGPSVEVEWKIGQDTSVTSTWGVSNNWAAIAAEIKASTGVSVPLNASSAQSAATLAATAATQVPFATSSAVSVSTLVLAATTQVPLGAASPAAGATLALSAPIVPVPAIVPAAPTVLTLDPVSAGMIAPTAGTPGTITSVSALPGIITLTPDTPGILTLTPN